MELYTLDYNFHRQDVIDQFDSVVWTERFSASGDVNLVVPATPEMIAKLSEGTYLSLVGSKEVMQLDTFSIDKGLMTVTGNSLLEFLNERVVRTIWDQEVRVWNIVNPPGGVMAILVYYMCTAGDFTSAAVGSGLSVDFDDGIERALNIIPGLTLGDIDTSGPNIAVAAQFGPILDTLKPIAETAKLGMSLYLDAVIDTGYSLKFTAYRGVDRTSDQEVRPVVRFSSALDTLMNIKEVRSIKGFKTVAYVIAPNNPGGHVLHAANKAYVPGFESAIGFYRRVLMVFAEDLTADNWSGSIEELNAILDQRARDALANNNYTKIVDGEVVPQSEFQYGVHYRLGDIIELRPHSEVPQKARITEYIRSQDATGERAYPTLSIVD